MLPSWLVAFMLMGAGALTPWDGHRSEDRPSLSSSRARPTTLEGRWIRRGQSGWLRLDFRDVGLVEADLDGDGSVDAVSEFALTGDTVRFEDREGSMCAGTGSYVVYPADDYVAFDLVRDDCAGRVKFILGFWVREDHEDRLRRLSSRILEAAKPADHLSRARMYLALGDASRARSDLDVYLAADSTEPRVWLNRAATRFPDDLEGVMRDADRAIALDPDRKTGYFLRGLARYGLGEKAAGCADFRRAIDRGFTVLDQAESQRCAPFWAP